MTGRAVMVSDTRLLDELRQAYAAERRAPPVGLDDQTIVEFSIGTCLLTRTTGHGDPNPQHTIWHSHE